MLIDPERELADVSCVSAAFCVATRAGIGPHNAGKVLFYHRSGWSEPMRVSNWLGAVSCTSRVFCIAMNVYPHEVYTYDGSSWTHTADLFSNATDVSCLSESACVAVGDRRALTFDGTEWVSSVLVPDRPRFVHLVSVSCVTAEFCVAVDDTGQAYTYDGMSWSKPTVVAPMRPRTGEASVSCGAVGMCVMVTSQRQAAVLTGDKWSTPEQIDPVGLTSVSCPGPKFCTAVDREGYAVVYRP